jgi:plasmid stabilization system protein ParE
MKVVWTERAWERLTEIEAFVARDRPEAAMRLVDKLIARGDALWRYLIGVARSRKSQWRSSRLVVSSYRIVYRRVPARSSTDRVQGIVSARDELPEDV